MFSQTANRLRNRKGFTLIELCVCIAIICVLAAMSLLDLNADVENANLARAKRDMGVIHDATNQYRAEMGPGSIDTVVADWCTTLKSTTTSPDGDSVGPWLGSCPVAPHKDGVYAVTKTSDYVADVTYTYEGKTIKLSELK